MPVLIDKKQLSLNTIHMYILQHII